MQVRYFFLPVTPATTSFRGGGGTFSAVSHESKIGRTTAGRKRPEIANYKVSRGRSKANDRMLALLQSIIP